MLVSLARRGDSVPGRSDLPRDEVVELVAPVRSGGKAEPAARRDLPDGVLERCGRDVVAFVGNHQAVTCSQLADISPPGERLQRDDIDDPAELGPAAAELAGLDAEELADTGPPLVGQRLAVDQDERRCGMFRDQRAGDDRLARPWRRDQDTLLMIGQVG